MAKKMKKTAKKVNAKKSAKKGAKKATGSPRRGALPLQWEKTAKATAKTAKVAKVAQRSSVKKTTAKKIKASSTYGNVGSPAAFPASTAASPSDGDEGVDFGDDLGGSAEVLGDEGDGGLLSPDGGFD
jgi:hypothetical protein